MMNSNDTNFLKALIKNHEEALKMAQDYLKGPGLRSKDAVSMADEVVAEHSTEIPKMKKMIR